MSTGGPRCTLRPLDRGDFPLIGRWLDEPHVRRWWPADPSDPASVAADYGPIVDGESPTDVRVVELDGRPVGFVQGYLVADYPEWAAVLAPHVEIDDAIAIDYLVGEPTAIGRGVGTTAIGGYLALAPARWPDARSVVVAVQQDNRASWRALERCGFTRMWAGQLDSPDPSDSGPAYVYRRPTPAAVD